jgi:hypothetical protein
MLANTSPFHFLQPGRTVLLHCPRCERGIVAVNNMNHILYLVFSRRAVASLTGLGNSFPRRSISGRIEIFLPRQQHPDMAEGVTHAGGASAIKHVCGWLDFLRTRLDRAP